MTSKDILRKAKSMQVELNGYHRFLYNHPGAGFDLQETYQYVYDQLVHIGYAPNSYGKCGLIVSCGHSEKGNIILLRADMDTPIHTAMLLGAARLLKEQEENLKGRVILLFQPAGKTFEGAKDMIHAGVLRNTTPKAAMTLHARTDMPYETGSVIVSDGGVSAPSADYFEIHIHSNDCYGSMPQTGVDPTTAAAHIIASLEQIHARELPATGRALITIEHIHAENTASDKLIMTGTIRSYDEDTRRFIKERIQTIINGIRASLHAEVFLTFGGGCPALVNDAALSADITKYTKELLGTEMAFSQAKMADMQSASHHTPISADTAATSCNDFAYFSKEVPSITLAISSGKAEDGCTNPAQQQNIAFNDNVLPYGAAVYAYGAARWLEEH